MVDRHTSPKVAIIYDWIDTAYGGAEKVIVALHQAFPAAPIYTSIAQPEQANWASDLDIRPTFLQHLPFIGQKPRKLLPFLPLAFESLQLDEFDVIISVTSALAKGVLTKPEQLHICYLLTPPRYLYTHETAYTQTSFQFHPLRWLTKLVFAYVRWWDQVAALRPDIIIPISNLVGERCSQYYQRKTAPVLYPPVSFPSLDQIQVSDDQLPFPLPSTFALVVSRLVHYKKIELAIQACLKLNLDLVIIGEGEAKSELENWAQGSPLIHFWGSQPQVILEAVRSRCRVVLMPAMEDFGLAAAEAVAAGKPVVVHSQSGVAEILSDGQTGVHISAETVEEVAASLERISKMQIKSDELQQSMRKYATTTFVETMRNLVDTRWQALTRERQYEPK